MDLNLYLDLVLLGKTASRLTQSAGREQSNLHDVLAAFGELGVTKTSLLQFRLICAAERLLFPYQLPVFKIRTSEPSQIERLSSASTVHSFLYPTKELLHYLPPPRAEQSQLTVQHYNEEMREPHWQSTNAGISLIHPHPAHIPSFFPAFPPIFTYESTEAYPKRITNPEQKKEVNKKLKQQAESNTSRLGSLTEMRLSISCAICHHLSFSSFYLLHIRILLLFFPYSSYRRSLYGGSA